MTRALAALLFLALDPGHALGAVPADTLIDVGGRDLEIVIRRGVEPVAIVFENGGGATFADWEAVPDSIAARTGPAANSRLLNSVSPLPTGFHTGYACSPR